MRNLPVLLFESVSLFFILDFSPQLAVDAVFSAFAFILQAVLNNTSHVSEQAERGKCCRPVSVDTNAVDELCGVLVAMLGGKMKIVHCFVGISRHIFAVEIDFSELVFGIVISVLGGYLNAADGFLNVLDFALGQIYFACKVRRIGIFLRGGTVKPTDSLPDIFGTTSPLYSSLPRINCAGAKPFDADRFSRRTASSMF